MLTDTDKRALGVATMQLVTLTANEDMAALLTVEVTQAKLDWLRFYVDDLCPEERAYAGVEPCIARIERLLAIAQGQGQLFETAGAAHDSYPGVS